MHCIFLGIAVDYFQLLFSSKLVCHGAGLMSKFSDKTLRWIAALIIGLAIYFLASAFYIPFKSAIKQTLLENAWQRTLADKEAVKAWPWATSCPVARIKIPELGVDQIILEEQQVNGLLYTSGRQLKTFYDTPTESMQINLFEGGHFNFLDSLQLGQHIFVQEETGEVKHYRVEDIEIVDAGNLGIQAPVTGSWLTLVTNYPFDVALRNRSLRYVVFAELVPAATSEEPETHVSI
jgi:sortase A